MYVGAYMLQAGLTAEMGDVTLHSKNCFHFGFYQASANLLILYQSDCIEIKINFLYLV